MLIVAVVLAGRPKPAWERSTASWLSSVNQSGRVGEHESARAVLCLAHATVSHSRAVGWPPMPLLLRVVLCGLLCVRAPAERAVAKIGGER